MEGCYLKKGDNKVSKARMATSALKWLFSNPGVKGQAPKLMNAGQIAMRLGPDAVFSTIAAAQTPGDLGDKLIVGGTDFLGSALTGLAAGRATGSGAVDTIASIGGAYGAMPVADTIMRGKDSLMGGSGQTPYERLSTQQQEQLKEQITQNVLATYGLLPGTRDRYLQDPSTGMGVS